MDGGEEDDEDEDEKIWWDFLLFDWFVSINNNSCFLSFSIDLISSSFRWLSVKKEKKKKKSSSVKICDIRNEQTNEWNNNRIEIK